MRKYRIILAILGFSFLISTFAISYFVFQADALEKNVILVCIFSENDDNIATSWGSFTEPSQLVFIPPTTTYFQTKKIFSLVEKLLNDHPSSTHFLFIDRWTFLFYLPLESFIRTLPEGEFAFVPSNMDDQCFKPSSFPKCQHPVILTRNAMKLLRKQEDSHACYFDAPDFFSMCASLLGAEIRQLTELSSTAVTKFTTALKESKTSNAEACIEVWRHRRSFVTRGLAPEGQMKLWNMCGFEERYLPRSVSSAIEYKVIPEIEFQQHLMLPEPEVRKPSCEASDSGKQVLLDKVLKAIPNHKDVIPYPNFEEFYALTNIELNRFNTWKEVLQDISDWSSDKTVVVRINSNDLCKVLTGPFPTQPFILMGRFDQNWGALSTVFPWTSSKYMRTDQRFCHGKDFLTVLNNLLALPNFILWILNQHTAIEHEKILSLPLGVIPRASEVIFKTLKKITDAPVKSELLSMSYEMKPMRELPTEIVNATFGGKLVNVMNNITVWSKMRKPKKRRVKVHALDLLTEHNLKSKFILSPPGIGEDCYRHWESLLMGSCVVTLALSIRRVFSLLPVLFVQRWEDITPALLEEKYTYFVCNSHKWNYKSLTLEYWLAIVEEVIRDQSIKTLNLHHPILETKLAYQTQNFSVK